MAVVTAGDILEWAWSHPTLGSGFFWPVSNVDNTLNLGGFRNNDQAVLDLGGRMLNQKNLQPWMMNVEVSNDPVTTQEQQTASTLAASLDEMIHTITHVSGAVYRGAGSIMGEIETNANKGTMTLKVCGAGQLQLV